MTLIDLGDPAAVTDEPVVAVHLPRLRRLVLTILTGAGLFAATASAPPGPPLVNPLWTAQFQQEDTMALEHSMAFLNHPSQQGASRTTAYDLATGKIRWIADTGPTAAGYEVQPAGDVVLVGADPLEKESSDYPLERDTVALDLATGRQLWRATGDAAPSVGTGDALLTETDRSGALTTLRLVRLRDGREIWKRTIPPATQSTIIYQGDRPVDVVTVAGTGNTTVYRYHDGFASHPGRLPWNETDSPSLTSTGPYLVVNRTAGSQTIATVYRADNLDPLWRSDHQADHVGVCGALICTANGFGVIGRDPATGRETWRRNDMTGFWDLGYGRLLLTAGDTSMTTTVLIDATSGRTLGRPFPAQRIVVSAQAADPLYVLRATTSPPARTAVSRLDPANGQETVLGTVGPLNDGNCLGVSGYLACPADGKLSVAAIG